VTYKSVVDPFFWGGRGGGKVQKVQN